MSGPPSFAKGYGWQAVLNLQKVPLKRRFPFLALGDFPVLKWAGKDKVVNWHNEVPFRVQREDRNSLRPGSTDAMNCVPPGCGGRNLAHLAHLALQEPFLVKYPSMESPRARLAQDDASRVMLEDIVGHG